MIRAATFAAVLLFSATSGQAQMANQMTQEQLASLMANDLAIQVGGPEFGYAGTFSLYRDGRGSGQITTSAGDVVSLSGSWTLRDGQVCQTWSAEDGSEMCETWVLTSGRSVDVYIGGERLGANRW